MNDKLKHATLWADYEKARAALLAEYVKVNAPLLAEDEEARAVFWADYVKVRDPLLAEDEEASDAVFAQMTGEPEKGVLRKRMAERAQRIALKERTDE